jgi:hypothetical protein
VTRGQGHAARRRESEARTARVVELRGLGNSWQEIGTALEITFGTARKLFRDATAKRRKCRDCDLLENKAGEFNNGRCLGCHAVRFRRRKGICPTCGNGFEFSAKTPKIYCCRRCAAARPRPGLRKPLQAARVRELYLKKFQSPSEIGRLFDCTGQHVRRLLKKLGIPLRQTCRGSGHCGIQECKNRAVRASRLCRWHQLEQKRETSKARYRAVKAARAQAAPKAA